MPPHDTMPAASTMVPPSAKHTDVKVADNCEEPDIDMDLDMGVSTVSEDPPSPVAAATGAGAGAGAGATSAASAAAVAATPAVDTVVIFDWDDTLLASTWLRSRNLALGQEVPVDALEELTALGKSVTQLLNRALNHGPVVIITNAETGWVELSAQTFMPCVLPLLQKVKIVSARSTYEPVFPDSPIDWKLQAFEQEIQAAYGSASGKATASAVKNVLSFGDSVHERSALYAATNKLSNALSKSIKFVERPSLEQLKRQVELVHSCMDDIARHSDHLDLMLTISLLEGEQAQHK